MPPPTRRSTLTVVPGLGGGEEESGTAAAVRERTPRPRGTALLFGVGAVLLGGVGMGLFLWVTGEDGGDGLQEGTYAVTYEVTGSGTVTVEYTAARAAGKPATRAASVELPWSKEVSVTRNAGRPALTVTLGESGGRAACAVTVEGRKLQAAVVDGTRGQATCIGELPEG